MRVLDLFAGIGGISLGLERAGMQTVQFVELEPFCQRVLRKHWPDVLLHDDIRTYTDTPAVDLIAGGFPCQDISAAGKGAGLEGSRSGLWWEMWRVIRDVRPRWVLVENVPALRTRGSDGVLAALEELGYACWPFVVGAWTVGAPHKRDRVWVVGLAQSCCRRLEECPLPQRPWDKGEGASGIVGASLWPVPPGERQHEWEAPRLTQSGLGRAVDGLPRRVDRLKALGNSVVPQVVEQIGRTITEVDCHLSAS